MGGAKLRNSGFGVEMVEFEVGEKKKTIARNEICLMGGWDFDSGAGLLKWIGV